MIYNLPREKRKRITNYLTFSSPNPFSISVATPGWNGKLYYSKDTKTWVKWTGNEVNATEADGTYALYFRGTRSTKIAGGSSNKWTLSGSNISCTDNIENLLGSKAKVLIVRAFAKSIEERCSSGAKSGKVLFTANALFAKSPKSVFEIVKSGQRKKRSMVEQKAFLRL